MHYLVKWLDRDESESSWVATSALEQHGAALVEFVASFEAAHVEAEDADQLEEDEYVIDMLIGRRYGSRSGKIEYMYLVRWKGYGEEEDSWEEAAGLPGDARAAYDASQCTSGRPRRGA